MYDVCLEYCLFDVLDMLENPPAALVTALGSSWIPLAARRQATSGAVRVATMFGPPTSPIVGCWCWRWGTMLLGLPLPLSCYSCASLLLFMCLALAIIVPPTCY
jgi:hypothetical protein